MKLSSHLRLRPGQATLRRLKEKGLDELRFHALDDAVWNSIKLSKKLGIATGIEVPTVHREERKLLRVVEKAFEHGADFVNLNELEFSDTNSAELFKSGFELEVNSFAAKGTPVEGAELILTTLPASRDVILKKVKMDLR